MTDPGHGRDATYIRPIRGIRGEDHCPRTAQCAAGQGLRPAAHHGRPDRAEHPRLSLRKIGALERHNVELIGATADAIDKAEDRERFKQAMIAIGLEVPKGITLKGQLREKRDPAGNVMYDGSGNAVTELAPESFSKALAALDQVGLPAVIRPSFTMGGTGGGIAYNREEFFAIVEGGLEASPPAKC